MTSFFKNYSFEYNAQRVDIFRSLVVCSTQDEYESFREGSPLNISQANFYGVIAKSTDAGARLTLDIIAESWARELRNKGVVEDILFRQADAIRIIVDHLIPDGWTFEYPEEFDTNPRYISYILRNGTYLSHIGTILDVLGLDYTIYSVMTGSLQKTVKAYYRDTFDGRDVYEVTERRNCSNLSITVDYGKIATSIVVMGAESEQGINQVVMDAEIGDWHSAPRAVEIRDVSLKKPEMSDTSLYFWYYPASPDDYTIDLLQAGDIVTIDQERMKIHSLWFLPEIRVASYESGTLVESNFPAYLRPLSEYTPAGVIVASIVSGSFTETLQSVNKSVTRTNGRALSPYGTVAAIHAIYDDVFINSASISLSKYLTYTKNLPSSDGFVWLGSERMFYRTCADAGSTYTITDMVRGVPTCGVASCEHRGTMDQYRPVGYARGCPLVGGTDLGIETVCNLARDIKAKYSISTAILQCPLVYDDESVCPLLKCPHMRNDGDFSLLCTKGLTKSTIEFTQRYQHHKGCICFPSEYYYSTAPDGTPGDTYELYARDSLINKYGYLPTRVSVKGIADIDGLDKMAEGRLRLSALPMVGKTTLLTYDPWVIPASAFPGDVISVTVASHGRFDFNSNMWYPTYWFDSASVDPASPDWMQVASNKWVQITKKFVIQKTTKSQKGMPEIQFGAGDISFQDITDYIANTMDVTSQRHRNQDPGKIIGASDTGLAAQVQNLKTGAITWVRMER